MLVFSLLIFTSHFVDHSYAGLFVEIYIRACDELTFFSKHARAYWRTGCYVPVYVNETERTSVFPFYNSNIGTQTVQETRLL